MTKSNRRRFLQGTAALATVSIVPRHVLGMGYQAPSDVLTRAIIGSGGMARGHMGYGGSKVLAICDVDKAQLKRGVGVCKKKGLNVDTYHDFREMVARPDIDIVSVVTPPHWHALHALAAINAGKDVWCEKPMTRTIGEGKKVVEACQKNGTMFRINTWFRLYDNFYGLGIQVKEIKKLVDNKMLGWPLKVVIGRHTGFDWKINMWSGKYPLEEQKIPEGFDYNFWLGPAPYKPYHIHRTHASFRGYWDYDGGGLGDMGMHYIDPVQYFLGKDNTSPIKIDVDTDDQHPDAAKGWRRITYTYKDGCQIILDGDNSMKDSPYLEGPLGKVYRGMRSTIPNIRQELARLPDPEPMVTDFHESVRTRKKFGLNEENGHRSTTIVNLGITAVRLNRTLHFDPDKQVFINDSEANTFIDQPMRSPWKITGGIL